MLELFRERFRVEVLCVEARLRPRDVRRWPLDLSAARGHSRHRQWRVTRLSCDLAREEARCVLAEEMKQVGEPLAQVVG